MDYPRIAPDEIAFTSSVKSMQQRNGSRAAYERYAQKSGWHTSITPECEDFIRRQTAFFIATSNLDGQPYIQHRGGPAGFLRVLDEKTLGFADFAGNKQYITIGNLADNPKAYLFLLDHENSERIKIWGEARVVEDDTELIERLKPKGYEARAERAILFDVAAWDANCSKHIPQRVQLQDVVKLLRERDRRVAELEEQVRRLGGSV